MSDTMTSPDPMDMDMNELSQGKEDKKKGKKKEGKKGISGDRGKKKLEGSDGNDVLIGRKDKMLLVGGDGDDVLVSGRQSPTMVGGAGSDTFVLNRRRGVTVIKDFNVLEGDKFALAGGMSFEQLTFKQVGRHTMIQKGRQKIALVQGVLPGAITAESFVAPPPLTPPPPTPA